MFGYCLMRVNLTHLLQVYLTGNKAIMGQSSEKNMCQWRICVNKLHWSTTNNNINTIKQTQKLCAYFMACTLCDTLPCTGCSKLRQFSSEQSGYTFCKKSLFLALRTMTEPVGANGIFFTYTFESIHDDINEKKIIFDCELVEWALIWRYLYQHRWMGVQMPTITTENSHFLWSGSQDAALVMQN